MNTIRLKAWTSEESNIQYTEGEQPWDFVAERQAIVHTILVQFIKIFFFLVVANSTKQPSNQLQHTTAAQAFWPHSARVG